MPHTTYNLENTEALTGPFHLAVGMFDGAHRGHQVVVKSAIDSASSAGGISGVLTFDPHPSKLLQSKSPTQLILPLDIKTQILKGLGAEVIVCQDFHKEFSAIEPENFLSYLKQKIPELASVHVGENFRFGKGRNGDSDSLLEYGEALGLKVHKIQRVNLHNEIISSTRIRKLLKAGEMESANDLLGYTYFSEGSVVSGKQIGTRIGFPTLNLQWLPELKPHYGVYAVSAIIDNNQKHSGVANYGIKPTFCNSTDPLLEVHLFEDSDIKSGTEVRVEWHRFIRPEKKFASTEELKKQIKQDKADALGE